MRLSTYLHCFVLLSFVYFGLGRKTPYYRRVYISEEKLTNPAKLKTATVFAHSLAQCAFKCNKKTICKTFCWTEPNNCLLTNRVVSYYFVDTVQNNLVECMTSLIPDFNKDVVAIYNTPDYVDQSPSVALDGFWCSGALDHTKLWGRPNNYITLDLGTEHLVSSITFCVRIGITIDIYFSNKLHSGDTGDFTNYELKASFGKLCDHVLDISPKEYVRYIGIFQANDKNIAFEYIVIA